MAATTARTVTQCSYSLHSISLVSSINTALQTVTDQNPNSSLLNQFSPNLNPNLVIEVIKSQTNPRNALLFFNWASNPNPNPNNYFHTHQCYSAMLDHLLSHGLFSTAATLLEQSNRLTDFTIHKIIKAHGDRGDIRGAIYWLDRARKIEGNRCLYCYNAVLGVLVRANRISLARSIFDQIIKECVVKPDVSTYTVLIRGYCKLGMVDDAKKVFDGMLCNCKPNLITYNTFLAGLCRKGRMESAREIVGEMIMRNDSDCLPDTVTFTTLIDGYCKQNEVEKAEECFEEMVKRNCEPNVLTYNALIYGLCMSGRIEDAKRMMTKMRLNGLKNDLVTHTSLLRGLCIVGRSDDAANHLKEMISMGLRPDVKAYGVVVNEHCRIGQPNEAIALLDQMELRGLSPSVSSLNALFTVLCDLGELDRAVRYLKKISQKGYLNFVSYSIVICSLCKVRGGMRDVEDLVVDMLQKGHHPDTGMYNSMVKGYCEDGDVHMAVNLFHEMMEKGFALNLASFSVFVNEMCKKGKATEVKKISEEMHKRCSVPDLESYRRILDENLGRLWNN